MGINLKLLFKGTRSIPLAVSSWYLTKYHSHEIHVSICPIILKFSNWNDNLNCQYSSFEIFYKLFYRILQRISVYVTDWVSGHCCSKVYISYKDLTALFKILALHIHTHMQAYSLPILFHMFLFVCFAFNCVRNKISQSRPWITQKSILLNVSFIIKPIS